MALSEFYCQSGGSNLNAGSTTANTASLTYASGNWVAGTGVFTVASGNPSSDGVAVGDFASVYADGSTTTGFVGRVTARDATTITVSLTAKAGTAPTDGTGNRTLKIGGAWKGPNAAEAFPFGFLQSTLTNSTGNLPRVNFKNGTNYAITAAMTHNNAGPAVFQGYTSAAGDGGKFIIDGGTSGASYVPLTISAANNELCDCIVQNNGASGSATGLVISVAESIARRVVVHDVRGLGISLTNSGIAIQCETYACNQSNTSALGGISISSTCNLYRCTSHDNTGSNSSGIVTATSAMEITIDECICDSNGQYGLFCRNARQTLIRRSDFYNNTNDGIRVAAGTAPSVVDINSCNLVKNGGYGVNVTDSSMVLLTKCGFGSGTQANTSGALNSGINTQEVGTVNYADGVTPWTDPANGDFRISLPAAKNTGDGAFTQTQSGYVGAAGYPDIGSAQHQDSGGSSGGYIF